MANPGATLRGAIPRTLAHWRGRSGKSHEETGVEEEELAHRAEKAKERPELDGKGRGWGYLNFCFFLLIIWGCPSRNLFSLRWEINS